MSVKKPFKKLFASGIFVLGLSIFTALSCEAAQQQPSDANQPSGYVIGPEDELEIAVWKNTDLTKVVSVRPDGNISLPLIGDVKAAGLTPNNLRDRIVERLSDYQDGAVVSVIVNNVNSYRVFILGEVRNPGSYNLRSNTAVLQALSIAGGFSQYASKNNIVLIRMKNDGTGVDEKINIRFADMVSPDTKNDKNLILRPGDTIFVP